MTIAECGKVIWAAVKAGGAIVLKALSEAKIENIVKAGVFVASSVVSIYIFIKSLRQRRQAMKTQENMSPVDRALALNFADRRNRKELEPLMRDVDLSFLDKKNAAKFKKNLQKKESRDKLREIRHHAAMVSPEFYDENDNWLDREILDRMKMCEMGLDARLKREIQIDRNPDPFFLKRIWDEPGFNL